MQNLQRQYVAFAVLSIGTLVAAGILSLFEGAVFQPYFGIIKPQFAIGIGVALGFVSLTILYTRGWFEIYAAGAHLQGLTFSAAGASLFAVAVIMVDLTLGYPTDINVSPPASLLFYPVMAYMAEVVFHALPLSLLLVFLRPIWRKAGDNFLVWTSILLASFIEPIFHLSVELSEHTLLWTDVYTALHVFAFNLVQLYVFRRYDFLSMYLFRIIYYLHWHILWGYLRLYLLN